MKFWLLSILPLLLLVNKIGSAGAGNEVSVRILFTNNSNGKLVSCGCRSDPYGGLGERVSFIRGYRESNDNVLLLDSGGYLGLSGIEKRGPVVFMLMKEMKYDALGIGDQELYFGLGEFIKRFGENSSLIINASLHKNNGEKVFEPYRVFRFDTIKIGVLGVFSGETFKLFPKESMDFAIEDIDTVLGKYLPELKAKCDYIVVLSQMGKDKDVETAGRWKDIDLIIGGHSQTLLEKPLEVSGTRIVQAGRNGGNVGEIILTFAENKLKDFSCKLIPITDDFKVPKDMQTIIDRVLRPE